MLCGLWHPAAVAVTSITTWIAPLTCGWVVVVATLRIVWNVKARDIRSEVAMGTRKQFVKIDGVWQTFPPPYSPGGRTLSRMMRPRRGRRKGFRKDWRKFQHLAYHLRWVKPTKKRTYWEGRAPCPGSGRLREYTQYPYGYCFVCRCRVLLSPTGHPNVLPEHTQSKRYQSKN